ncbi:MAG: class I SAM-dependent methyltransferase [Planctomycetaceae bacterium]|jgi:S-adenosylmethionine-diacylgycerolhomoserine-N-methlytransferase
MSLLSDLRVLWHLLLSPIRGTSHAERLNSFYAGQAADYDAFRARLLKGRGELLQSLPAPTGGVWVDMGGGTGANLEAAPWLSSCRRVVVADLCQPLLDVCRERVQHRGWSQVEPVLADVTTYDPGEPVDLVTFSYSLTMIPDWFRAVERARAMLAPGGVIGIVDFYVSRKYVPANRVRHGWLTRSLIPVWFATDNVHPSRDHLPYLESRFETVRLDEDRAAIPYVPLLKAPYYRFVGRKPLHD